MLTLDFNNQTNVSVSVEKIRDLLLFAKKILRLRKKQTISLALVSSSEIRKWNKRYRGRDVVTDVLSFTEDGSSRVGDDFLGEVLICPARARSQAREFKQSLSAEINRLALHGYLHLLGYDHVRSGEAKKMAALEKKALEKFYG